jgi:response regulator RpfG family c-di-GMP phosphodiesterase
MTLPAPAPPPPELKRILIVDDEQVVLTALKKTLELEGYEVSAVEDPLQAIHLVHEMPFSVVLSDQQMPGLSGLEFLAMVKEVQPNATRILITAVLSLNTVIEAINRGEVYRFIVKPWLREELLMSIRNAALRYELLYRNGALHAQTTAMNEQLAAQLGQLDARHRELQQLHQTLQKNLERSVELCAKTMETFYPLLGLRARRVFAICQAMADTLKLPDDQRRVLEICSRLYDVGLVGAQRELIRKWQETPELLTPEERAVIELHPALGQELVAFVADLEAVGTTIRAHHERYDGSGYPDKLGGDDIPWLARLLAVAVAYGDYPSDGEAALEYVKTRSGAEFDPDAVRALIRCLPQAAVPRSQRTILLSELQPGMVVAQGIYSAFGILLIPEGQPLAALHIDLLKNHNRMSPITQSLLVYC